MPLNVSPQGPGFFLFFEDVEGSSQDLTFGVLAIITEQGIGTEGLIVEQGQGVESVITDNAGVLAELKEQGQGVEGFINPNDQGVEGDLLVLQNQK